MNKKLPLWFTLLIIWIFIVITVLFGWAVWRIESGKSNFGEQTKKRVLFIARFPHLVSTSFRELRGGASKLYLPTNKNNEGINGLKLDVKNYVDSNYLLLASYDKAVHQSTIKLLRLSDQKTIHQWVPNINDILHLKKGSSDQGKHNKGNFRAYHPLLAQDGAIYFNFGFSPLIKMSSDSHVLWSLDGMFNHSLEFDAEGNIWTPCRSKHSKFESAIFKNYKDDKIMKISPDGKVLFDKSVSEILLENGYKGLLWGVGSYETDILHLNDIQPALTSSDYWLKGDLLISIRHKSTVFLYRPSTNKIIWLKTGPWLNQHDVDFIDNKRIGIFGNDIVRVGKERLINGFNQEYVYDFSNDSLQTPYSAFLKSANVGTLNQGRSDILPNGDLFVEETNSGRLLRGDQNNTIWEYVERIDNNLVSLLVWCRFITCQEFKELTFVNNKN